MATYSDSAVNVVSVSGSGIGTHYTVPAGRRAKVYVQRVTLVGGGSSDSVTFGAASVTEFGGANFNYPDNVINDTSYASQFLSSVILLNEGDSISTAATASVDCVVEEYTNP